PDNPPAVPQAIDSCFEEISAPPFAAWLSCHAQTDSKPYPARKESLFENPAGGDRAPECYRRSGCDNKLHRVFSPAARRARPLRNWHSFARNLRRCEMSRKMPRPRRTALLLIWATSATAC